MLAPVIEILGSHSTFHAGVLVSCCFSVFWQVRLVIWLYIVALYLLVVREQLHSAFWATKLVLEEVYEYGPM